MLTKQCIICKQLKDESEFYKHHSNKDGLCKDCKLCYNESRKKYYKLEREKYLGTDEYKTLKLEHEKFIENRKLQHEKFIENHKLEREKRKKERKEKALLNKKIRFILITYKGETTVYCGVNFPNEIVFRSLKQWNVHLELMKVETYKLEILKILTNENIEIEIKSIR